MNIIKFIKKLLPSIEKNKVLEDLRISIAELEQTIIPIYNTATTTFEVNKFKSNVNKDLSVLFYRAFDLQGRSKQSNFISEIDSRLINLLANAVYIRDNISEIFEHTIVNEGLSAKKAILLRAAGNISFITRFSLDLLTVVCSNEKEAINKKNLNLDESDDVLAPMMVKRIDKGIKSFAMYVSDHGVPNNIYSKIIGQVPNIAINTNSAQGITSVYKESDIDPFISGMTKSGATNTFIDVMDFTYNPIFHVRLMIAEWQAERYKASKDKKKLLELRLLSLKMQLEDKYDAKLEQEIIYIQNRVNKIDYYLLEVEKSLEIGENR